MNPVKLPVDVIESVTYLSNIIRRGVKMIREPSEKVFWLKSPLPALEGSRFLNSLRQIHSIFPADLSAGGLRLTTKMKLLHQHVILKEWILVKVQFDPKYHESELKLNLNSPKIGT